MDSAATTEAGATPGLDALHIVPAFDPMPLVRDLRHHDVAIKDDAGRTVFLQRDVVAPSSWHPRAVQVAASKYLYGDPAKGSDPRTGGREPSILDLHCRVARFLADRGRVLGVLDTRGDELAFEDEVLGITLGQYAAFNSPVWFNAGLDQYGIKGHDRAWAVIPHMDHPVEVRDTVKHPQCSACFIQAVADSMESLMKLARNEAMLFKHGSGTGTDFSTIRSKREKLTGGGTPSGPVSFMKIYDRIASVVKSGGKTRRAAKMQTMHVGHPDILDFITVKGREEAKARALIAMGWDADFNGDAYDTVAFQNANFSVRVDAAFMDALTPCGFSGEVGAWPLRAVTTGDVIEHVDPRAIWAAIAEETHRCGDPGLQFSHTINDWHTCPRSKDGWTATPINSSNPCSEFLFIDDSSCNLASINLMKFQRDDGHYDVARLRACVRVMIVAQEILVDASSYPTREIARNSHDFRPLGLGFANLGGLLQANGIAYDSDDGRLVAGVLAAIICGEAYATSALLADKLGVFEGFPANARAMRRVIDKHITAWRDLANHAYNTPLIAGPGLMGQVTALLQAGEGAWEDAETWGGLHGYRNAQVTVVAPTGTIAFMMDCDTTGIEPSLALRAWKALAGGGGMWVPNRLVPRALASMGYSDYSIARIIAYLDAHGTLEGCENLMAGDLPVFDCSIAPAGFSRVLRPEAHLLMMAAVQPFVSGAISKTVNCPAETTPDQIAAIYRRAEELGLKAVAIFRDGSKGSQPLTAKARPQEATEHQCKKCGSPNLVPAGTCGVCAECGEPTGGCG